MFSVIFEVQPNADQWEAYLGHAKLLRPELEQIDGFIDNIRYRSLARDGWILSLSNWQDEKSLIRWRTHTGHHAVQEQGRAEVLMDYHLRVGQLTRDTRLPAGRELREQRLDETEVGEGTTIILIDATGPGDWVGSCTVDTARRLGLDPDAGGLGGWDLFEAVLTPGDVIVMMTWRDHAAAEAFEGKLVLKEGARLRRVRVVRDYGMFDRREAPQYYPAVKRAG